MCVSPKEITPIECQPQWRSKKRFPICGYYGSPCVRWKLVHFQFCLISIDPVEPIPRNIQSQTVRINQPITSNHSSVCAIHICSLNPLVPSPVRPIHVPIGDEKQEKRRSKIKTKIGKNFSKQKEKNEKNNIPAESHFASMSFLDEIKIPLVIWHAKKRSHLTSFATTGQSFCT